MWQNRETNWRCGSLSENFITFLKTPKIINTKQYIHPKKPPIFDYVAKSGNKLETMKVLCPKSIQREEQ
jgi:hypothetical protein